MNILQKLTYDHDKIIKLIQDIENLGYDESQLRKPLFHLLQKQLLILNEAETNTFYKDLEKNFKSRKIVTKLKKQNDQIENMIKTLKADTLNSDQWHKDFNTFKKLVAEHILLEENKLFPVADEVLSERQEERLCDELTEDKQDQWDLSTYGGQDTLKEDFIKKTHAA